MTVVAIIQARMGSTRLPGKVLMELAGQPMLARVVNKVGRAETIDRLVVATSVLPVDDVIATFCEHYNQPCFRGSEDDVLDRYYQAAVMYQADVVIRITADCPLIEPQVIDHAVQVFKKAQPTVDYVANTLPPRTFPRGLDVEVMRFDVLAHAWHDDTNPAWREHVTPFIYRHPELFNLQPVINSINYAGLRWTVDTPEDLAFVRRVYDHFGHDQFTWQEVLAVLEGHPDWQEINRGIEQKAV